MENEISLEALERSIDFTFDLFEQRNGTDFLYIDKDYYFCVDLSSTYKNNPAKNPSVLCGQLYDGWAFLEGILSDGTQGVALMLDHVAPLLRFMYFNTINNKESRNDKRKDATILNIKIKNLKKIAQVILKNTNDTQEENRLIIDNNAYFYIPIHQTYDVLRDEWPEPQIGDLHADLKALTDQNKNLDTPDMHALEPLSHLLRYIAFKTMNDTSL